MEHLFTRDEMKIWVRVPVRWSDMDAYGHVNNAKYMTYFEAARINIFTRMAEDGNWQGAAHGPVLGSVTCNFRREVRYPAVIDIGTRVAKISRRSFHFEHALFLEGTDTLVADGRSAVVWLDRATGKSTELAPEIHTFLERLV